MALLADWRALIEDSMAASKQSVGAPSRLGLQEFMVSDRKRQTVAGENRTTFRGSALGSLGRVTAGEFIIAARGDRVVEGRGLLRFLSLRRTADGLVPGLSFQQ